jgi:hypothetical protein
LIINEIITNTNTNTTNTDRKETLNLDEEIQKALQKAKEIQKPKITETVTYAGQKYQ